MWKYMLPSGLKLEQPNATSKNLILSVLNSTATKREAREYLTKYSGCSSRINHCLLLVRQLGQLDSHTMVQLSATIKRICLLGLRLICVLPPAAELDRDVESLENIIQLSGLSSLRLPNYHSQLEAPIKINLSSIHMIPIIKPVVYYKDTATEGLTRDFTAFLKDIVHKNDIYIDKFVILNNLGGIPSNERQNGTSHIFINLSQEFLSVKNQLYQNIAEIDHLVNSSNDLANRVNLHINASKLQEGKKAYREHIEDLTWMNAVLSCLPSSTTGVVTSIQAAASSCDKQNPLIYNILTDRSLISSSLPRFKKSPSNYNPSWKSPILAGLQSILSSNTSATKQEPALVTTVFKKGISVRTFNQPLLTPENCTGLPSVQNNEVPGSSGTLDMRKVKEIIDKSFHSNLDLSHYVKRINGNIASIVIIGDYEGIAILTHEGPVGNRFVYLDKFAVLPHLKGSLGISDIIFNVIFKKFPHQLFWRSRKDNVVNKWYFQRSVGVLDLSMALGKSDKVASKFKLFYYGDPDYVRNTFQDSGKLKQIAKTIRDIEPSWVK